VRLVERLKALCQCVGVIEYRAAHGARWHAAAAAAARAAERAQARETDAMGAVAAAAVGDDVDDDSDDEAAHRVPTKSKVGAVSPALALARALATRATVLRCVSVRYR
jgi:hypothetical protein